MSEDKKNNVVGIGHNNSEYSKEQYAKLVNSLHHAHKFAAQEMRRVKRFFDEAFTKYPNSNPHSVKLKDFEIHECRNAAIERARKYSEYAEGYIDAIEKKAKADGIKLKLDSSNLPVNKEKDEESNG